MLENIENYELMIDGKIKTTVYSGGWGVGKENIDDKFIHSVCKYYNGRMDTTPKGSMWHDITHKHTSFEKQLREYDLESVKKSLEEMFVNFLTDGIVQGHYHYNRIISNENDCKFSYLLTFSKLISVMQYQELIPVFYPENNDFISKFDDYFNTNPNELILKLINKTQINLTAPKYSNKLFGMPTDFGLYCWRDFVSMGIAMMINDKYSDKNIQICEIGGGVGHLAFYLNRFGFNNVTVVDLPTISTLQMYFLGINQDKTTVNFLSPERFDGNYDLIINVDSMTEMPVQIVHDYISKLKEKTKFISINHEINPFTVNSVCKEHDLKRTQRHHFWMRKGYVYEEYEKR